MLTTGKEEDKMMNKYTERLLKLFDFLSVYQDMKSPMKMRLEEEEWFLDLTKEKFDIQKLKKAYHVSKKENEVLFQKIYEGYAKLRKAPEHYELAYGIVMMKQKNKQVIQHVVASLPVTLTYEETEDVFTLARKGELNIHHTLLARGEVLKEGADLPPQEAVKELIEAFVKCTNEQWEGVFEPCNILYLKQKPLGIQQGIEYIKEDLKTKKELPSFIADIVGYGDVVRKNQKVRENTKKTYLEAQGLDQKVLFTKPANKEQLLVAKHLERNDAVLVQGPPGTGKTHTIANLTGHLMSQGKSVLITSYHEKALGVVKEQLPKELQDLCMLVTEETTNKKRIVETLQRVHDKRGSLERSELIRRITTYEKNREACFKNLERLKGEVKNIKLNEYTPIKYAGKIYKPLEAARYIDQHKEQSSWLIGPIRQGALLPLSEEKIKELYQLASTLSFEEEMLCCWPIEEKDIIDSATFKKWIEEKHVFKQQQIPKWYSYLSDDDKVISEKDLKAMQAQLDCIEEMLKKCEPWMLEVLEAGQEEKAKEQWQSLIQTVKEVYQLSMAYADELLTYTPEIMALEPSLKPLDVYAQISQKLQNTGKLSKMTLLLNPQMKTVIEKSRVKGRMPQTAEDFEALTHFLIIEEKKQALKRRWKQQMESRGAQTIDEMGASFEVVCQKYCEGMVHYLEWYKKTWQPFTKQLEQLGMNIKRISEIQMADGSLAPQMLFIRDTAIKEIKALITYKQLCQRHKILKEKEQAFLNQITSYTCYTKSHTLCTLKNAIQQEDSVVYEQCIEKLIQARLKQSLFRQREEALEKLSFVAPNWAEYLRRYDHETATAIPENIEEAWLCHQFMELLGKRHERTMSQVKKEISETQDRLNYYTKQLAIDKAWLHKLIQFDSNRSEAQALEGWKQLMLKIGAGKGKQVEKLKQEVRQLMPKCQSAIPVWMMSIHQVANYFDARQNKFDVVIIDEASQLDVTALIALYLGKQVVVVGDHEQVSPLAIGEKQEVLDHLIQTYLKDIPHHYLYSGKCSIYDLAQLSGYQPIRLNEHFRCVPEIIGYSNQLAYQGHIKPLRASQKEHLAPMVCLYVPEGIESNQVNVIEAEKVVQYILECCKDKRYKQKTFGVISLRGDKQAAYIDTLLQRHMNVATYEKRRILCGTPAHFQGDERDVIILTMVDSKKEQETLRLMTDTPDERYKKRYNVAMSRAKDQVIIVHSFDLEKDLKEGDFRKGLFSYYTKIQEQQDKKYLEQLATSTFEQHIQKKLQASGYSIETHDVNGEAYVGLCVCKAGKRLYIMCDSEKWQEEIQLEEEMTKQTVLERVGWQFIYLTASHYFQDEKTHWQHLVETIEKKLTSIQA